MKKAFTLIELLVVIAIIAILAAILFPVFAQAKAAAKGAASISNAKQHVLACLMYAGDNEDFLPINTEWNTGTDPLTFGVGLAFSSWGWSVQPYMKSGGLFHDPLTSPNTIPAGFNETVIDSYESQYGYNFTFLSTYVVNSAGTHLQPTAISGTAPAEPTNTVMITSKWAESENQGGGFWGVDFGFGYLYDSAVDAPDCAEVPEFCLQGWGTNNGFYDDPGFINLSTVEAGRETGGVSLRSTSKVVIGWVDGHASKMAPTQLAAGTNYTPGLAMSNLHFTDATQYRWDLK